MSDVSKPEIDLDYVVKLARLELNAEEQSKFGTQMNNILEFVNELQKVDVSQVPDTPVDPFLPTNVIRKDEVRPSFTADQVLSNAPQKNAQQIVVPKIVE